MNNGSSLLWGWKTGVKEGLPPFLFFDYAVETEGIPVFEFHRVEAEEFRRWLEYLIRNGYRTLSFSEFYERIQKVKPERERSVLLTFDDGWENQWHVAYPILKELNQRAIFFVNPALVTHGGGHKDDFNFFNWDQAREMVQSGCVEIHSHTLTHEQSFAGSEIVDFQHPTSQRKPRYHWLWSVMGEKPGTPLWGAPVYALRSRIQGPRYLDDENLRRACMEMVAGEEGIDFFKAPEWRIRLRRFSENYKAEHSSTARWETEEEYRSFVHDSLARSKALIEAEIGHFSPSLAFPWESATPFAVEEAKRLGYQAAFWGTDTFRQIARYGQDLFRITRIQGCWIYSLKGEGRVSFWDRFRRKISTRSK